MMIFPSRRLVAILPLSKEMGCRVDVSRNKMAFLATVAMNLLLPATEREELPLRIGKAASSWDPVDMAKIC